MKKLGRTELLVSRSDTQMSRERVEVRINGDRINGLFSRTYKWDILGLYKLL